MIVALANVDLAFLIVGAWLVAVGFYLALFIGSKQNRPDVNYDFQPSPAHDPDSPLEQTRREMTLRTERAMARYEAARERRAS